MNAWKLTRIEQRENPRTDWPERWKAAGEACDFEGASRSEMIALKNSPIWHWIGQGIGGFDDATGEDTPPFAINSGLGWIGCNFEHNERNQNMNENKTKLILLIATRLTDEQCAMILSRIEQSPEVVCHKLISLCNEANKTNEWDEAEHPRAQDGKFTHGHQGEGMTALEYLKVDRDKAKSRGDAAKVAEISEKMKKLRKIERDEIKADPAWRKRHQATKDAKKFYDLDEQIDQMEEEFADRGNESETQDQLRFEDPRDEKKYESLKKKRDALGDAIDWDSVDQKEIDRWQQRRMKKQLKWED